MSNPESTPSDLSRKAGELLKNTPASVWHPLSTKFLRSSEGMPWVIACSGGADSIMVLLLAYALFPKPNERLTVIHFNHQMRGDESRNDAVFVEKIADRLGLNFELGLTKPSPKTDEGTLRKQRQKFYRQVMNQKCANVLIQGHNLDDIAETMLWRIPRGVGVEGLCAPRPVQELFQFYLVRPLLTLSRDYIRKALTHQRIDWRDDSTNDKTVYLRNRIRKNTLPQWRADSDRNVLQGVCRTRNLLEEQDYALGQWAREVLQEYCEGQSLRAVELTRYPRGLIRKVITLWLVEIMSLSVISHNQLDQILDSLDAQKDFKLDLARGFTLISQNNLLSQNIRQPISRCWRTCSIPFNCKTFLPNGFLLEIHALELNSELLDQIKSGMVDQRKNAYLSLVELSEKFYFRQRQKGDRFDPLGSPGSKKVKDWMIDRQWPQDTKDRVPLIVNYANEIIWIPGFPPLKGRSINSHPEKVIRLTYTRSTSLC